MLFYLQHYCNYKYLQAPTKGRSCIFALCKETRLLPRAIHGPTDPHSLQLSAHIPTEQPVLLSHTQWLTAGRTGAQPGISCPFSHQCGPTDPDLTLPGCSMLRISLPQSQSWPHSAAASPRAAPDTPPMSNTDNVVSWQEPQNLHLLFHCLNHWNEYTTQPRNSCLREAAATKLCQQWHTTETQAVEAAQQ